MKILKFAVLGIVASLFLGGCVAPHHGRVSGGVSYDSAGYYGGRVYYDSDYYYDRPYYRRTRPVIYNRRPVVIDRRPVIIDRRPVVVRDNHKPARIHSNTRPPYKHGQGRIQRAVSDKPNLSVERGNRFRNAKANFDKERVNRPRNIKPNEPNVKHRAQMERKMRDIDNSKQRRIIPPKDRAYKMADRRR